MSKFSFEEMGAVTVSFAADTGVKGGQVVKVTEDGTVGPCADGGRLLRRGSGAQKWGGGPSR